MDDIVTVLAEEHGCLDTIKVESHLPASLCSEIMEIMMNEFLFLYKLRYVLITQAGH